MIVLGIFKFLIPPEFRPNVRNKYRFGRNSSVFKINNSCMSFGQVNEKKMNLAKTHDCCLPLIKGLFFHAYYAFDSSFAQVDLLVCWTNVPPRAGWSARPALSLHALSYLHTNNTYIVNHLYAPSSILKGFIDKF